MRLASTLLLATLTTLLGLAPSSALAEGDELADSGGDASGDPSTAWFVDPLPNTVYEGAPVTFDVEIGVEQGTTDTITDVELLIDGTSIGTQPCAMGCVFADVELEQGVYEFSLVASPAVYSVSVDVYVDTEIPQDAESGLGCNAQGNDAAPWLLALPLLGLGMLLRRRPGA